MYTFCQNTTYEAEKGSNIVSSKQNAHHGDDITKVNRVFTMGKSPHTLVIQRRHVLF